MKTLTVLRLLGRWLGGLAASVFVSTSSVSAATPPSVPIGSTSRAVPAGVSTSDWSSIRAAYEAGRHAVFAIEGGHQARNPGQQWQTKFDGRGFTTRPNGAGWEWGLELRAYGFGDRKCLTDGSPEVKTEGQQLTYVWDANVQEWFVNDQRGLEHGFTVMQRPLQLSTLNSQPSTFLTFDLAVRGTLRAEAASDGQGARFTDEKGIAVVTYGGLKVWDADGKALPARLDVPSDGPRNSLRVSVDERGARYPLTIDPIAQQGVPLRALNAEAEDRFGNAVAISGDTVVVAAYVEDSSASQSDNNAENSGAVYVFVRTGQYWSQQAYLKASNREPYDFFGWSVAISGDILVVGAPGEDSGATVVNGDESSNNAIGSGAAYVFVRRGTTWSQQAYLKASNAGAGDQFGQSVSLSGTTVLIGAHAEDSNATGVDGNQGDNTVNSAGAAYVFVQDGFTWSQQAYLKASNTGSDRFGWAVSISGETAVVGADQEASNFDGVDNTPLRTAAQDDDTAVAAGAAYVFVRNGTTWSQQAYLKASNSDAGDWFGSSVSVSGNTVVVGALRERSNAPGVNGNQNDNTMFWAGAAYVFARNGTTWSQQAYLKASNPEGVDQFGVSVAVSGDTAVVGANFEDSATTGINSTPNNNTSSSGAAYVFRRSGTNWSQEWYLKASDTERDAVFGESVAVAGDTIVIGSPSIISTESGSAYVFSGSLPPEIVVEQPAGTSLTDGMSIVDFGSVAFRGTRDLLFVIRNIGEGVLTGLGITIDGAHAGDFSVVASPSGEISGPAGATTFTVRFNPGTATGLRSAALHISSNDSDESPFDVTLTASALGPPEGLSVASGPLVYPLSGGYVDVDASATVRAPMPHSWAGSTLEVNLQPFTPGEDQLELRPGSLSTNLAVATNGVISFGGTEIGALSTNITNGLLVTFNSMASTEAVEAVARHIYYRNNFFADHIATNSLAHFGDRTVTFRLAAGTNGWVTQVRVVRFPYLVGLEADGDESANPGAVVSFDLVGVFSDGGRTQLRDPAIQVGSCPGLLTNLRVTGLGSFVFDTGNPGTLGGVCYVNFSLGGLRAGKTFYVNATCFIATSVDEPTPKRLGFKTEGRPKTDFSQAFSLGNYYALQALMNQTEQGRRLTSLYWQHTRELVDIVKTNSDLLLQVRQVLVDFQPALSALLLGNGSGAQITQPMIDQLNVAWSGLANAGSPALQTAMETERARFDGFDEFVDKNFSEWADLLEVPAPTQPYIHVFNKTKQSGRFIMQANYLPELEYSLWKSSDLGNPIWEPASGAIVEVSPWGIQLTDTNVSPTYLFYKVGAREAVPAK